MTDQQIDLHLLLGVVYGNQTIQSKMEIQRLVRIGTDTHAQHLYTRLVSRDKALDILSNAQGQVGTPDRGIVEVAQPKIGAALGAALTGVEQPFQMALDGMNPFGGHLLPGAHPWRKRFRIKPLEQASVPS
ncbi:MAG TPA: hypothetical protein VME63_17525 [Dyella sp.]|nr:hypothetical protein [Dyella sp.]HTV87201.1 hypothetical protein [Dyella sp.]